MNKKLMVIIAVVAVSLILFVGYKAFLSPEGVDGEKQVTVQVVIPEEDIDESFEFNSDQAFLLDLLKEKQDELGAEFLESDFGTMVIGMMDYKVDDSKQEFFHIAVNGEDAVTGAGEIPLNDGDIYKFELMNY